MVPSTCVLVSQRDGRPETVTRDWFWVTTLTPARASTAAAVTLGHGRWTVENQGFNEMVSRAFPNRPDLKTGRNSTGRHTLRTMPRNR